MLKNKGPRMGPCGSPIRTVSHSLKLLFTLTFSKTFESIGVLDCLSIRFLNILLKTSVKMTFIKKLLVLSKILYRGTLYNIFGFINLRNLKKR